MIRLVALDLDGTLIGDDFTLSLRIKQTIAAAQAQDIYITLATGRMLEATRPFANALNITLPLICYQGGLIQAPQTATPLHQAVMEHALMHEVLNLGAQHRWHLVLYAGDQVFMTEKRYPDPFYQATLGRQVIWVEQLTPLLERHQPLKFLVVTEPENAAGIEHILQKHFAGRMEIVRSHARFVEGNPLGVSKGAALERLALHLGLHREEVMAVGDQGNDLTMITWAGLGVAMGNATPAVKAAADWIAPSQQEDGAAVAIERFVLDL